MSGARLLIRRETAELAVPLLDRALANVLDVPLSQEHLETLAQARASIFAVLNEIYAEYPELDNSHEPDSQTVNRLGEVFQRERAQAAESLGAASSSDEGIALKAALDTVVRAATIIRIEAGRPGVELLDARLSEAQKCIQSSLEHVLRRGGVGLS